jgi:iron complex transport system substrate-binding protein
MMRVAGAAIVLAILCSPVVAAPPPQRIMSLKICTDELLMDLVPASRIASLSYLSQEKPVLKLWPEAAHIAVNHNSLEEILAAKPDLVITLAPVSADERAMLGEGGVPLMIIPEAGNFEQIRTITRALGDAVGEHAKAEALIAGMDAKLRRLEAETPRQTMRVAGWGGGGYVPGRSGLFNAIVAAAGGSNMAGGPESYRQGGYYDVESLIAARPDLLAYGDEYIDAPSLRLDQNAHPVLTKLFANRRVFYSSALVGCGVPQSADAAVSLAADFRAAMRHPGGVP